ncbi:MAG: NUDIX hydrolase [Bacilli bacterium]|nr:NUDIX hydrolase [Bacilli bacterium]
MGYIKKLRKKIGHDPIINVGATVLVFNEKNEVLLNLRSDTNNWGIPGGSKELKETLKECAIRELKEETNLDTSDLELVMILSGKDYYYKYPNEDEVDCVIALYQVKNYSGKLYINDGESTKLQFFSLDNLPELESRAERIFDGIKSGTIKL